mmetsp:Transcript_40186/g.106052  ORF Transcript_40186/g.106052 Transcript_40186/m.106052 type:complete len:444 (-) Transcript_40186:1117-2448(-)
MLQTESCTFSKLGCSAPASINTFNPSASSRALNSALSAATSTSNSQPRSCDGPSPINVRIVAYVSSRPSRATALARLSGPSRVREQRSSNAMSSTSGAAAWMPSAVRQTSMPPFTTISARASAAPAARLCNTVQPATCTVAMSAFARSVCKIRAMPPSCRICAWLSALSKANASKAEHTMICNSFTLGCCRKAPKTRSFAPSATSAARIAVVSAARRPSKLQQFSCNVEEAAPWRRMASAMSSPRPSVQSMCPRRPAPDAVRVPAPTAAMRRSKSAMGSTTSRASRCARKAAERASAPPRAERRVGRWRLWGATRARTKVLRFNAMGSTSSSSSSSCSGSSTGAKPARGPSEPRSGTGKPSAASERRATQPRSWRHTSSTNDATAQSTKSDTPMVKKRLLCSGWPSVMSRTTAQALRCTERSSPCDLRAAITISSAPKLAACT